MSKGHSPLGASQADRWFACPGSVELIKMSPPQQSNQYAERGTYAHFMLENCFDTDISPWFYEGHDYPGGTVDEEDIHAVQEAIDWLDDKVKYLRRKHMGIKILKEVGFDLSRIHPDLWGTSDIVIYTEDFSFLGIYDYKHGKKLVNAEENLQLMYYGLGAINFTARSRVPMFGWGGVYREMELGIIQPRVQRKKGSTRVWSPSAKRMDEFAVELETKAKQTKRSTEYEIGEHCYYCTGKALCPQIYKKKIQSAKDDFRKV